MVDGYFSDLTYMAVVGEPSARQKEVYNHLLEAQQAAANAMRPGRQLSTIPIKPPAKCWMRPAWASISCISPGMALGSLS